MNVTEMNTYMYSYSNEVGNVIDLLKVPTLVIII